MIKWFKRLLGVAFAAADFCDSGEHAPVCARRANDGRAQSIYLSVVKLQSAYDQLAKISQANGGKLSAFQVKLLGPLTGRSSNYKVGEYEFDSKATLSQLLTRLSQANHPTQNPYCRG